MVVAVVLHLRNVDHFVEFKRELRRALNVPLGVLDLLGRRGGLPKDGVKLLLDSLMAEGKASFNRRELSRTVPRGLLEAPPGTGFSRRLRLYVRASVC